MISDDVLEIYKELTIRLKTIKLKFEILESEKTYLSTLLDKSKQLEINMVKIKALKKYYEQTLETYHKLQVEISKIYKSTNSLIERIVFEDYIMNEMTVEELQEKHKSLKISRQTIYNMASMIRARINRIKVENIEL